MIQLVIVACLATAGPCRDFELFYDPQEISMMMCVTIGHFEIARWQADHPDWSIQRWRCGYVPPGQADI